MSGGTTVSAIPDNLIDFGVQGTLLDGKVSDQATTLGRALSTFINSDPDPKYIGSVPRLDRNVDSFATTAKGTDSWVGRVGEAFKAVAKGEAAADEHHFGVTDLDPGKLLATSTQGQISASASGLQASFAADVKAYVAHQQYQAGQRDAKQLQAALNDGSGKTTDAQIQALVQKLKGHVNDPDYCAGYFNQLGPNLTLSTVGSLMPTGKGNYPKLPPGNPLQTFDEALASASHSSLLQPDFVTKVFPQYDLSKLGTSGQPDQERGYEGTMPAATALLRYGTYSQAFLAQGLHTIVMPYMNTPQGQLVSDARLNPEVVQQNDIVLEALARNPTADARILSSKYSFTLDGRTFTGNSNLRTMLEAYGKYDQTGGGNSGGGLAAAIAAVSHDPSTADQMAVLQDVGATKWSDVPDVTRPAIASVLAGQLNNPAFTQHENAYAKAGDPSYLTWQENLFIAAVTDHGGKVDQSGLATLQAALKTWLTKHPVPSGTALDANPAALSTWEQEYGTLVGLTALGSRAGDYKSAADAAAAFAAWNSLFGDVTTLFPPAKLVKIAGGGVAAQKIFSLVYNNVKTSVTNKIQPSYANAESHDQQVYQQTLGGAQAYVTTEALMGDPDALPPAVRAAYDHDPSSKKVEQFITAVATARSIGDVPSSYGLSPTQRQEISNVIINKNALASQIDPEFEIKFH